MTVFRLRAGGLDGGVHGGGVVAVDAADDVPAVALEALGGVVGEPVLDVAVDRDAVVVIQHHQLGQLERAGQRAHFVRDAFHKAAVAGEGIGVVVDDGVAGLVELGGQQRFGQRHADGIAQALAQRAGGGFHARGDAHFGVARRLGMQLAEVLQFFDRQVVAGQVQQRVDQHRAVAVGQHEAVAVGPGGILGVVAQVADPEGLGDFRHAHGSARVPGVRLLHGIHREGADGIRQGKFRGGRIAHSEGSLWLARPRRKWGPVE